MWGLYASSGQGFVVEFDTRHDFFKAENTTGNALRKIKYTNDNISDFWRNPLYLFFVKNSDWSFEREWRMLKSLSQCDRVVDQNVFLCSVKERMIKSVIFGYSYDKELMHENVRQLSKFDSSIVFRKAFVDNREKTITFRSLTSV
jgi:hypothetical protein